MAEEERRDVQLLVGGGIVKEGLVARAVIEDDRERAVLLRVALFLGKLDISALDERTNEMLIKNARNTVEQAKMTTCLAAGSSIKADTLETTWRTIVDGIDETRRIQEEAHKQRIEDQAKLERIKQEFQAKFSMPDRK